MVKRKFEERRRSYEASMNDDLHHPWNNNNNNKLDVSSNVKPSSQCRARLQRRITLSPSPQKPQLQQRLSRTSATTRPVSPDHTNHSLNQLNQLNQQHSLDLLFQPIHPETRSGSSSSRKVVRFADPLVQVREITRICHHASAPANIKSTLFYSKQDYMKFYVRERSRLAFQDLTKRLCREQERRIRNRQRVIPPYFVCLNFWNAVMTINELGQQVKQQQQQKKQLVGSSSFQQQQQFALHRQQKRRRRHLIQTLQQQQRQRGPDASANNNNNNNNTASQRIPNNTMIPNHHHHPIPSPPNPKPRCPRRNTVCAAVA